MKGVLFDLDGTLLDTAPDLYAALCKTLAAEGLEPISYDQSRKQVSNGARAMIADAFGISLDAPELSRLNQILLDHYSQNIYEESVYFADLDKTLDWLDEQQIPWGIITNKPERFTTPLLKGFDLHQRSHVTLCPEHVTQPKPAPEAMYLACKQIGLATTDCLYVGDHPRDIESGQAASMPTIAALYGYLDDDLSQSAPWGASYSVTCSRELLPLLKQLITPNPTPRTH